MPAAHNATIIGNVNNFYFGTREEKDTELNEKRENSIILIGLSNPTPSPTGEQERETWWKYIVSKVLDYPDNIFVIRSILKVCYAHKGINPLT